MPVSAKLLRKFSEAFGTEVAAELMDWANQLDSTLRDDLKEVAEQYFARFDARLEQRLAETKAELRQEIASLRNEMQQGFSALRSEMALQRTDTIKWMFTFFAGGAVTTVATVWGVVSLLK